jgi:hypothetical protein
VASGPVQAASKPKHKPAAAHTSGTWTGQLARHGNHWDYVGSACPAGTPVCSMQVVHYRINPTTAGARAALQNFNGGTGSVTGQLRPANDRGHQGMLLAKVIVAGQGATSNIGAPGASATAGGAVQGADGPSNSNVTG